MIQRRAGRAAVSTLVVLLLAFTPASVFAGRAWTVDASPTSLTVGTPTDVTLTVQDTSSSGGGGQIACVSFVVPGTFAVSGVAIVSVKGVAVALLHGWVASSTASGS